MEFKVGIVGSGMIANDCLRAFSSDSEKENTGIKCSALCVRPGSLEKGMAMCEEFLIPELFTEYTTFLKECDADFIYIGIVNTEHYYYAREALEAGRNVILEKPFTMTYQEAINLAELAKKRKLYLFEAITTLYFPNFMEAEKRLSQIGDVKIIQCNFSQYSSRYDRYLLGDAAPAFDPQMGGGALNDLNIYNLHFVIRLFGEPQRVRYDANRGFNNVDTSGVLTMYYPGFLAECVAAKDSSGMNFGLIQGTKGTILMRGQTSICEELEITVGQKTDRINVNQYKHRMLHEFIAFKKLYEEKNLNQCYRNLDHSLMVMKILERACENK